MIFICRIPKQSYQAKLFDIHFHCVTYARRQNLNVYYNVTVKIFQSRRLLNQSSLSSVAAISAASNCQTVNLIVRLAMLWGREVDRYLTASANRTFKLTTADWDVFFCRTIDRLIGIYTPSSLSLYLLIYIFSYLSH
jgi:hypothetical protein